jgi:hypothetical protein
MIDKSETIAALAKALSSFQKDMSAIAKDAKNPFFKSKYVTLSAIIEAIRKPLAENSLSFTQFPTGDNGLTTILMHDSGEYIASTVNTQPTKNDPQSIGSAITYMRRYALGAILGLSIQEDDDGNAASNKINTFNR